MDVNLIRDLVEQNKKLMTRIIELQEKKTNTPEADEAEAEQLEAEPKPRRVTHPRVKPPKPQLRRSPRNHSPTPTPSPAKKVTPGAAMRRRLSYTSAGKDSDVTPEKRSTPTKDRQLVRQTLGTALKMEIDDLMLGQHFRDSNRYFKVDEFRHHAFPIVEALHDDAQINTAMYTKTQLFKLAINIAKKREFYIPKKKVKLSPTKKRKLRAEKAKAKKARAAAAVGSAKQARAAAAVDAAKTAGSDDAVATKTAGSDDAVAAKTAGSDDAPDPGSDDDATNNATEDQDQSATDSDNDILALIAMNTKNQKNRAETKEALAKKKATAAAHNAAAKAAAAKAAADKSAKKVTTQKVTTQKAQRAAAAKDKAELEVTDNYVKAMGAAAAAASKMKAASRKKLSAAKKQAVIVNCLLRVGQRVAGRWDNDDGTVGWFDGTIVSIDYEQRTAHIHYDDDDIDDSVPWNNVRILDELRDG